jgi:transposase
VINRRQINKLLIERNQGVSIEMSAMKAGISRNTARKYLQKADPTAQTTTAHTWRTREDPLARIWPAALKHLEAAPELEAKLLFEFLREHFPERVGSEHLRTFQRRVRQWRLKNGKDREVFFTQDSQPGQLLAVDWTDMGALGITIAGQKLDHLLFHAVLPHSNWEWAVRCRSESLLSLRGGLRQVLGRLGRVPRQLLIDNSSTATHQLSRQGRTRGFNAEFLAICEHYKISPRTINVSSPNENGACESMHGHLKRRVEQYLLLRGSRDFPTVEDYDALLMHVLEKANRLRAAKLLEELVVMREHLAGELPDYEDTKVRVSNNCTIRIRKMVYSVPSRLIGAMLTARIYETCIVLLEGREVLAQLPRHGGDRGAVIDFRHIIGWLLLKPGAFAQYRWREQMFPTLTYRAAYDHLLRVHHQDQADRMYLAILQLAATEGTTTVDNLLEEILNSPKPVVAAQELEARLDYYREQHLAWRDRGPLVVALEDYDQLLDGQQQKEDVSHGF